jgi:hypothetical protein
MNQLADVGVATQFQDGVAYGSQNHLLYIRPDFSNLSTYGSVGLVMVDGLIHSYTPFSNASRS